MPHRRDLRRRRVALWNADPRCFYCRQPTVLGQKGSPRLPLAATIEHLRSRHQPERTVPPRNGEPRYVLACWACNNAAGRVEELSIPIEERRRRSNERRDATPVEVTPDTEASRPAPASVEPPQHPKP